MITVHAQPSRARRSRTSKGQYHRVSVRQIARDGLSPRRLLVLPVLHQIIDYRGICDQRTLDFRGAHAVAGDVDHVVDAAGDPVIAVGVAAAAVAGKIFSLVGREISLLETRMVAIDGAHLPRP